MNPQETIDEKRFWTVRFTGSDECLTDDELKRLAHVVDSSDFRDTYRNRMRLHYSLRASRDADRIATAVREFDKSSTELGRQMKAIARAQVLLAVAMLILAGAAVVYAPWAEIAHALKAF